MSTLEKAQIQGNILRGYTYRHAAYLFYEIRDVHAARRFLGLLEVATATPWPKDNKPATAVTVAFSYAGLERLCHLETGSRATPAFSAAMLHELGQSFPLFKQGMLARAAILGDRDTIPGDRDDDFKRADWRSAQLWVSVYADTEHELDARVQTLDNMARPGLQLVADPRGNAIERNGTRYEHFGFQDNISNPEIEGAREPDEPAPPLNLGNGKRDPKGQYQSLQAGEFLLGYPNESGDPIPAGPLAAFMKNGSFAVFRKLYQDVAGFRKYLNQAANKYGRSEAEIGAMIVGRKQDGEPLTQQGSDETLNNFGYSDDRDGARCPLASHVRRTHPRDASGVVEVSHRLLRRGMPYGPVLADGEMQDDRIDRGLLFIVLNADLERQFEFVQRRWVNAPTGTGLPDDYDPLVGGGSARMVLGSASRNVPPPVIESIPSFVTCLGGGYFFVPSLAAIQSLAEGAEPPAKEAS